MELLVISAIVSILLKLIIACKWTSIMITSVVIGMALTIIGCLIPVESHTMYQHGFRGNNELHTIHVSHTPSWQNIMFISFFLIPLGSLFGYVLFMWMYILSVGV